MIQFVEKEPYSCMGGAPHTKMKLIPVFMVKDSTEYFVSNIPIAGGNHSPEYLRAEMEGYKAQLLQNEGRYYTLHGFYDCPEDMIAEMIERNHTFEKPGDLFCEKLESGYGAGFVEFQGNHREVSAAFHYRIYNREYAATLQELVKSITEKKRKRKR